MQQKKSLDFSMNFMVTVMCLNVKCQSKALVSKVSENYTAILILAKVVLFYNSILVNYKLYTHNIAE